MVSPFWSAGDTQAAVKANDMFMSCTGINITAPQVRMVCAYVCVFVYVCMIIISCFLLRHWLVFVSVRISDTHAAVNARIIVHALHSSAQVLCAYMRDDRLKANVIVFFNYYYFTFMVNFSIFSARLGWCWQL